MDFFIDTGGANELESNKTVNQPIYNQSEEESSDESEDDEPAIVKKILENIKISQGEDNPNLLSTQQIKKNHKKRKNDIDIDEELDNMGLNDKRKKGFHAVHKVTDSVLNETKKIDEVLKKSIIANEDFEKLKRVPMIEKSEKALKLERKKEREKTKGKKWYGLPATELTEEVKNDLEILQMRSVLDPKHFYKKNDLKVLPKYFQIGKVMDSPLDYYNNRLTKKERKKTLVDELLADAEFNKYNKKKYKDIIEDRKKSHYKAYRQAKKLKRKNKT